MNLNNLQANASTDHFPYDAEQPQRGVISGGAILNSEEWSRQHALLAAEQDKHERRYAAEREAEREERKAEQARHTRAAALEAALRINAPGGSAPDIIKDAKAFSSFLTGQE